ncbi:hypothetical protein D7Y15_36615 [Corallococcus sp. AB030]|uniref:hypothetical protein n=1 Tax=Corallococcus sp. AB030 TaxID=2316716 RepID=UPI000EE33DD5|nr:hypothetical protein [Corallococcus sp. AB030]RKI01098.1 hypothetical protein D7Y15_36615 [Corallococcus sp. AB030]
MGASDRHLDVESAKQLERREPEAVRYFAEHLSHPCETCEAFLARDDAEPDALPGLNALADEALVAASGRPVRENAVGWARVRRKLRAPQRAWLTGGLGAVAAAILLALVVRPGAGGPGSVEPPSQRIKGTAPLALELTAAARLPDGEVRAVAADAVLPPEAVVLLRYHASESADALLVREAPGVPPQVLGRHALTPGTHDLRDGEDLAGVSLEDERGPVTLVLVAWPHGEQENAALEAVRVSGQVPPDAAQARLRLKVESGHAAP